MGRRFFVTGVRNIKRLVIKYKTLSRKHLAYSLLQYCFVPIKSSISLKTNHLFLHVSQALQFCDNHLEKVPSI